MKKFAFLAVFLFFATGCRYHYIHKQARLAEQSGDYARAVVLYEELVKAYPDNLSYRASLRQVRFKASQFHFRRGQKYQRVGEYEKALVEFRKALELDPTNQYAKSEFMKVKDILSGDEEAKETLEDIKKRVLRDVKPPTLDPRSPEPIDLRFPEPVSVFDIYNALGKAFGINIVFDPELREEEISIELEDVTAEEALEILMQAVGHFYKVIDEHTILIAQDTPQNRKAYESLVMQVYFLSNADAKSLISLLRTLVDMRKVVAVEDLNAIAMRDTANKAKIAERLIGLIDKSKAEVVVDVELIQIDSQSLTELGVNLSSYSIVQGLDLGEEGGTVTISDIPNISRQWWSLTLPSFIYNFLKQNTNAEVLARPQLRISENEKATLHIGDKVPVPVTQFNTAQTVGGNIVPITSFQYQDVGIKIDITPRVHHNFEITLDVKIEVSNISGFVEGGGGQNLPRISTRKIETTIRLKDGETNLLAGLIRDDSTFSNTGVPGITEIPILGRLFSNSRRDSQRTELVLTLTPHIIRKPDITEEDLLPLWIGTERNLSLRGFSPRVDSPVKGPFDNSEREDKLKKHLQKIMSKGR